MKKLYFLLFTFLISAVSFGQDMIITGTFDGPLSGGTPKLIEVYVVNDIADTSIYGIGSANNGGGTDGEELTFDAVSATAGDFIYIGYEGSNTGSVNTYFGITANYLSNAANNNGDDALELFMNGGVIDTFGDINTDGSGQPWEYLDGWAYRVDGTGPDSTNFILSNWTFSGPNAVDGCTDNASCASVFPIGTYSSTGSTTPNLTITTPNEGQIFNPGTTTVNLSINVQNFVVGNPGGGIDGHIHWTINGSAQPMKYNTNDESISVADGNSYTVYMELVDNSHQPIVPAVNATVNFSVASMTQVVDITALRADVDANGAGGFYEITGGSLVTHTDSFRNRKWIQDGTISGVLIYDQPGTIVTTYNVGDMVTGLRGTTQISNGVLRFLPTEDSGVVSSSGNAVTPQVVAIADLNATPDDYESELIEVQNISFVDGDGVNVFATGSNYDVTDGTNTIIKRTDFFSADYIGQLIPQNNIYSLVAVAGEYNGTAQIYVRDLNDFTLSSNSFDVAAFGLYPNPTSTGKVTITTTNSGTVTAAVYNVLGKEVINRTITNNTLDVSNLNTGLYIVKLTQNGNSVTKKLVVK